MDEAPYWLEMLVDSHILAGDLVAVLVKEANELLAMTVASGKDLCESEGDQSKSKI